MKQQSIKCHNCRITRGLSNNRLSKLAPINSAKKPLLRLINSLISTQPPINTDKTSATGSTNNNPKNRVRFVMLKVENRIIRFNLSAMNWLRANFN